jgi:DNA repair exonuclease SbcCD ATPase subunit
MSLMTPLEKIQELQDANAERLRLLAELQAQIPRHRDYKYFRIHQQIEKIRNKIQAANDLIESLVDHGISTSLSGSST